MRILVDLFWTGAISRKKLLFFLGFFLVLNAGLAQNICLQRTPTSDTSGSMGLSRLYNTQLGPLADFTNDGFAEFPYYAEYASFSGSSYYLGAAEADSSGIYRNDTNWISSGSPHRFATGDFNEDGNDDFVSGGYIGPLSIYFGDGHLHFTAATITYSGGYITGIGAADLDADGHLDLVVAGQQMNSTFTFLHGNGNGTFAAPVMVNNLPGMYPFLEIEDYNNDGTKDVAISYCGIFFNDGLGNFSYQSLHFPQGWFGTADFNNDGAADLIGADSIYFGSGFGNFPVRSAYALPAGVTHYSLVADMDGDGRKDLPAKRGANSNDTLLIFLNNGNGSFSQSNVLLPLDSMYAPVQAGDLDGNGTNDLVVMRSYVDFETPRTDIYQLLNRTVHINAASSAVCQNDSLQLFATSGNDQYSWSTGDTAATAWVNAAGNYTVTATSGTCSSSAVFTVSSIFVADFAPLNSTGHFCYYSAAIPLTTGSPQGGVYSGPGVSGNSFNPQQAGTGTHTLYYTYNGPGGCTGTDSLTVTVELCLGTDATGDDDGLLVFPNPASERLTIEWKNAGAFHLVITDLSGKIVLEENDGSASRSLDISSLATGVYFLHVSTEVQAKQVPLLIQR